MPVCCVVTAFSREGGKERRIMNGTLEGCLLDLGRPLKKELMSAVFPELQSSLYSAL